MNVEPTVGSCRGPKETLSGSLLCKLEEKVDVFGNTLEVWETDETFFVNLGEVNLATNTVTITQ